MEAMKDGDGPHRYFLTLFLPAAVLVIVLSAIVSGIRIDGEFERMYTEEATRVRLGAAELDLDLRTPRRVLRSLPTEDSIRAAIDSPEPDTRDGMARVFLALLQRNPNYAQIRWIDENGRELVRVNRSQDGGRPVIVAEAALQDKSSRDYFLETTRMEIGKIFVSELDLNIENGKIEIPYNPTIRFVTPVADRVGNRRGILAINYLASQILENFVRVADQNQRRMMLLNSRGDWLSSPNPTDEWGSMLGHTVTFGALHPGTWVEMTKAETGHVIDGSGLWTWVVETAKDPVSAEAGAGNEPSWFVVSHQPEEVIRGVYFNTLIPAAVGVVFLLLLFSAIIWQILARAKLHQDATEARIKAESAAAEAGKSIALLDQAQKASGLLTAIIDASEDAILSKDLQGTITSWNRGAEKLFGYRAEEAIGKSMLMLFPPGTEAEEEEILKRIKRGEVIGHFETVRLTKAAELIDISVTISPILDGTGRIVGASKIARGITETKRAQAELDRHREHLEELVVERTTQIRDANEMLREREKFIRTITDNLPGMVAYWDRDLRCRFANAAHLDRFGLRPDEILGMTMPDLIGEDAFEPSRVQIEAVLAGEQQHFNRAIRKSSGEIYYGLTHYIPDRKDGTVIGFFVLVTDVTSLKLIEGELRDANDKLSEALDEARAASRTKTQFLANMSHEIRTPMNAVLGFIGLVLEDELSNSARRHLTTAYDSAKSLLVLINDILDVSKLQSTALELQQVNFSLPSLLRDTLDMLRTRVREKGLSLDLTYHPDLSDCYLGDPMRIRQIVTNFVGNAIKFTEAGSISVSVASLAPNLLRITVSDTGIGMTEAQSKRIFQSFVQADASTSRRFGGTGLGLTICEKLAEIMGGRIELESEFGKGSRFLVTLRLEPVACLPARPDQDRLDVIPVQPARRFRILAADDIQENRELLEARLTRLGHDVVCVSNGREAVDRYEAEAFDLILMDVQMPVMNGLIAAREIRRLESGHDDAVPIIALTASVMLSERERCFEAGMTDFIAKPLDFGELFRMMEQVVPLGRGHVVDAALAPIHQEIQYLPSIAAIDVGDGLRRWGDTLRYGAALGRFAVKQADAADRLRELHRARDWRAAYELSHALKGVAGNLAVSDVARIASRLCEAFNAEQDERVEGLIGELATALVGALAAIGLLRRSGELSHEGIQDSETPRASALSKLSRDALMAALETDDPGTIGPVLDRLSPSLTTGDLARLRDLVSGFDFEQARAFAGRFAVSLTDLPASPQDH
jgi:PAS domain S-box-containing protein